MRCAELILAVVFKLGCKPLVIYELILGNHDQLKNKIRYMRALPTGRLNTYSFVKLVSCMCKCVYCESV